MSETDEVKISETKEIEASEAGELDIPEEVRDDLKIVENHSRESKKTEITFGTNPSSVNVSGAMTQNAPRITRMFQSMSTHKPRHTVIIRPIRKFLPTYRLESQNPFNARVVEDLIKKIIESQMELRGKIKFETRSSLTLCRSLSEEVLNAVKAKNYDRFRIIVTVTVGEKLHQSFCQSASYLWDAENDAMANYVYDRPNIFVITTVYGVYYD